jgi:large subunit ribosomal protein L13
MTTHIPKIGEADRKWFVIDARDQILGKLATTAAVILSG